MGIFALNMKLDDSQRLQISIHLCHQLPYSILPSQAFKLVCTTLPGTLSIYNSIFLFCNILKQEKQATHFTHLDMASVLLLCPSYLIPTSLPLTTTHTKTSSNCLFQFFIHTFLSILQSICFFSFETTSAYNNLATLKSSTCTCIIFSISYLVTYYAMLYVFSMCLFLLKDKVNDLNSCTLVSPNKSCFIYESYK